MVPSRIAAKKLGVHPNTLRKWANEGKINVIRTPGNNRLYDVEGFLSSLSTKRKVIYCRVSSKGQQDDLSRQIQLLRQHYPVHELITDIGSGLNFKRPGLQSLLEGLLSGEVEEIVVAHRDRLSRFGFELFTFLAERYHCRIVVLDEVKLSPQEELIGDLLSIIHVFSCRLYGLRKYRNKIKEDKDISEEARSGEVPEMDGAVEVLVQPSGCLSESKGDESVSP